MARSSALGSKRDKVLLFEKIIKRQLLLSFEDGRVVEDLTNRLDNTFAKKRRDQTIIESVWEQLLADRSDNDHYRQSSPFYAERFTADVAGGSSGLLYSLSMRVKKLVKKQHGDIDTAVKTYIEDVDAFLRSIDSELSRPGPYS